VSSAYRLLCVSHSPAITLEGEWHSGLQGYTGRALAERAASHREPIDIEGHEHCDLLIGRYSYPLVEVGCPGIVPGASADAQPKIHGRTCFHRGVEWVDSQWLALMLRASAEIASAPPLAEALALLPRCWRPSRIEALRGELIHDDH
jgi:hypothetical protein